MNIFFGAQGAILNTFSEIDKNLRNKKFIKKSAYWISEKSFFDNYFNNLEFFNTNSIDCIYQWEILEKINKNVLDPKRKSFLETKYKNFNLWEAIVADRRLMYGKNYRVSQSYQCKYDHKTLNNIIFDTLDKFDEFFSKNNYDFIVTFVPSDYGDYLLKFVAAANNIKFLQLRSVKIDNFVTFLDTFNEESIFDLNLKHSNRTLLECKNHAINFIEKYQSKNLKYDGSHIKSRIIFFKELSNLKIKFKNYLKNINNKNDNYKIPIFKTLFFFIFEKKIRLFRTKKILNKRNIPVDELQNCKYIFFPMHKEPEVALSVYARDFQNQIEVVRRSAQSIPLDYKLIVKEHPLNIGYRSSNYYKKLLNIPNVYFADINSSTYEYILNSQAVITIKGASILESLILKKPVCILGNSFFSRLPVSMVISKIKFDDLYDKLVILLNNYKYDENALIDLLSKIINNSIDVNLYSNLLIKTEDNIKKNYEKKSQDIFKLSDHFEKIINEKKN